MSSGLWQELEAFETNLNRTAAKRFMHIHASWLTSLQHILMHARTVLRQLVDHVSAIYPPHSPDSYCRFQNMICRSV